MDRKICEDLYSRWGKAIERSFDWVWHL